MDDIRTLLSVVDQKDTFQVDDDDFGVVWQIDLCSSAIIVRRSKTSWILATAYPI